MVVLNNFGILKKLLLINCKKYTKIILGLTDKQAE